MTNYRYRIGNTEFETHDEAEEWVAAGNIGGTYEVVRMLWCDACLGWRDAWYNPVLRRDVCGWRCSEPMREELRRLRAWEKGEPIKAYNGLWIKG